MFKKVLICNKNHLTDMIRCDKYVILVKVKVTLYFLLAVHHAMKAYWGSEVIVPLIL
jgi:hypothetical protein